MTYINPVTINTELCNEGEVPAGLVPLDEFLLSVDRDLFRLDLAKMRSLSEIGNPAWQRMSVPEAGFRAAWCAGWVERAEAMLEPPEGCSPHDGIGDLMTLREWRASVDAGGFIDYDGHGYWATEEVQGQIVLPSEYTSRRAVPPMWVTHVAWYNR